VLKTQSGVAQVLVGPSGILRTPVVSDHLDFLISNMAKLEELLLVMERDCLERFKVRSAEPAGSECGIC
jgi:hypothetical protein